MPRAIHPAFFLSGALLFCSVWLTTRPLEPTVEPVTQRTLRPAFVEPAFIELDAATLERYAGKYEARGNFVAELTLKDGSLFVQGPGFMPSELRPTSETEFFLRGLRYPVVFDVGRGGTVRGFSVDTEFGVIRMKRAD